MCAVPSYIVPIINIYMIDIEQIRLPDTICPPILESTTEITEIGKEWFIRGPISGAWICQALDLPGDYTPHVAHAILYAKGFSGKSNKITLERFHLKRFGVKKDSTRRALKRLQGAGLIEYTKAGQKYRVTILPAKPKSVTEITQ